MYDANEYFHNIRQIPAVVFPSLFSTSAEMNYLQLVCNNVISGWIYTRLWSVTQLHTYMQYELFFFMASTAKESSKWKEARRARETRDAGRWRRRASMNREAKTDKEREKEKCKKKTCKMNNHCHFNASSVPHMKINFPSTIMQMNILKYINFVASCSSLVFSVLFCILLSYSFCSVCL